VETAIKATSEIVRDYSRLFVNRGAYTLQSSRPHPESGRHYYFRPKAKETSGELALTAPRSAVTWKANSPSGCTRLTLNATIEVGCD